MLVRSQVVKYQSWKEPWTLTPGSGVGTDGVSFLRRDQEVVRKVLPRVLGKAVSDLSTTSDVFFVNHTSLFLLNPLLPSE